MTEGVSKGMFPVPGMEKRDARKSVEQEDQALFSSLVAAQLITPEEKTPVAQQAGEAEPLPTEASDLDAETLTVNEALSQRAVLLQKATMPSQEGKPSVSEEKAAAGLKPAALEGDALEAAMLQKSSVAGAGKTPEMVVPEAKPMGSISPEGEDAAADSESPSGVSVQREGSPSQKEAGGVAEGNAPAKVPANALGTKATGNPPVNEPAMDSLKQTPAKENTAPSAEDAGSASALSSGKSMGNGADAEAQDFLKEQLAGTEQVARALAASQPVGTRRVMARGESVPLAELKEAGTAMSHTTAPSAMPAPPPAATSESVVRFEQLMEKFDQHLLSMTQRNEKSMVLTVEPEAFGRLTVSCREEGARLLVEIHAENGAVREVLMRQEDSVRQLLQDHGVKLGQFDVTSGDGRQPRQQQGDQMAEERDVPFGIEPAYKEEKSSEVRNQAPVRAGLSLIA